MKISELDLLHHHMILGNLEAKETLRNAIETGVKNKCPIVQDFLNRAKEEHEKNNPLILKSYKIKTEKRHKAIIKTFEKPYTIIKWFLFASTITAVIVELYYA